MEILFLGHYYIFIAIYFVAISVLLLIGVYIFRRRWIKKSRTRTVVLNLSISVFFTLYTLLALEGIFAYSFVQSDGIGLTLASKRWFYKHWNPINSYGYRDYEPEWRNKRVFIVGDSFAAGAGVENINDRFSNILSTKLGASWNVTILAQNGWDTQDYINALINHDQQPDVIIISYFINDFEGAASDNGIKKPLVRIHPNKLIRPLVNYSYLINWIYYRIYKKYLRSDAFWKYVRQAYNNGDVWKAHLQELDALIEYANRVDAKIGFIVWPNLRDVSGSKDITYRVSNYLNNKGVMALDLSRRFEKRDANELIVNLINL